MVPVLVGILVVYGYRDDLFGRAYETPVQIATTVVLIVLGWQIARDVGRALGPTLFRRLDPGHGGHGRLPHPPRLRRAGDHRRAARRRARPAHAGRRRRLHRGHRRSRGAADARQPHRRDRAAQRAPVPGRRARAAAGRRHRRSDRGDRQLARPALHDLRAGRRPRDGPQLRRPQRGHRPAARARRGRPARPAARGVTPLEVQELLDESIETPIRDRPQIVLEEIDGDEVVVRISATPERPSDGPRLASEVLEAVAAQTARAAEPSRA